MPCQFISFDRQLSFFICSPSKAKICRTCSRAISQKLMRIFSHRRQVMIAGTLRHHQACHFQQVANGIDGVSFSAFDGKTHS